MQESGESRQADSHNDSLEVARSTPLLVWWLVVACVLAAAGGLVFRSARLDERPMHHDESVQAVKSGILFETGEYRYDPNDCHGPSLYYLTLPFLWLSGARTFAETNETSFRMVPVVFGVLLILLVFLVADGLGSGACVWVAVLTAVSPAMVFYSRCYFQEMSLVFFTFATIACGWRFHRHRIAFWAIVSGTSAGMMFVTKETCIIAYSAILLATAMNIIWHRRSGYIDDWAVGHLKTTPVLIGIASGIVFSALFFSSFAKYPWGIIDSVRAYQTYCYRGYCGGDHVQPWNYYLGILIYWRSGRGPVWTEGFIIALAIVGIVFSFKKRLPQGADPVFLRFLVFYSFLMVLFYSAIPYKTPWCMLSFHHALTLLAGFGASALLMRIRKVAVKVVVCCLLLAGTVHLGRQAYLAAFRFPTDTRNPYVYAHTVPNLLKLVERVETVAEFSPEREETVILVISADYWPLPWYFRGFRRVGYWTNLRDREYPESPIIITSPAFSHVVEQRFDSRYKSEFYGLRPDVMLVLHIRDDLWEAFMETRRQVGSTNQISVDAQTTHSETEGL